MSAVGSHVTYVNALKQFYYCMFHYSHITVINPPLPHHSASCKQLFRKEKFACFTFFNLLPEQRRVLAR